MDLYLLHSLKTGMDITMKDETYWETRFEKSRVRNEALQNQLSALKKEHKALQKEIKRQLDLLDAFPTGFILLFGFISIIIIIFFLLRKRLKHR